ncbi:hypothetical protein CO656_02030 [Sinorhizobium sp. FG01]|nr:hypothetical protein CO656_02030 [Sinorhizobium sp. FG01]
MSLSLKRVAFKRVHAARFRSLFLCMSSSQNRCTLLGDMHQIEVDSRRHAAPRREFDSRRLERWWKHPPQVRPASVRAETIRIALRGEAASSYFMNSRIL